MLHSFSELMRYISEIWQQVGVNQKIAIVLVGVVLVASLFFWGQYAATPDYGLLYKGLAQKDAAEIVSHLTGQQIPVKLADNGTTVMVPSGEVYRLRIELAAQNLPASSSGYSLFDNSSIVGVSDSMHSVNMIRAIQGELEKTISSLSQIEWARVMIAKPEQAIFKSEQKKTTAAVTIKTRNGYSVTRSEIAGIANLVAASVEGLSPNNITITDDHAKPLLTPREDTETAQSSDLIEMQEAVEDHLTGKVIRQLEDVLGPGKVSASIRVIMDHSKTDTRNTDYSEILKSETTTSSTTYAAGAGGAVNANPRGAGQKADAPEKSVEKETTSQYDAKPSKEIVISTQGSQIKRVTAAVFIEAGTWTEQTDADGNTTSQYTKAADTSEYEAMVKAAIGYDETWGDTVTVIDRQFWRPDPVEAAPEADMATILTRELTPMAIKHGPIVLLLIVFAFFARRALRKMENVELPITAGTTVGQASEMTRPAATSDRRSAPASSPETAAAGDDTEMMNAETTAEALKAWMHQ